MNCNKSSSPSYFPFPVSLRLFNQFYPQTTSHQFHQFQLRSIRIPPRGAEMGGGVLRTASKAAAFGAYRRATTAGAAARRSAVPAPPAGLVTDAAPMTVHMDEGKGLSESANPAVSQWELDDWEFAGWKSDGEEVLEDRLVFGPVPTLEEAQEATGDLTRALESANEPKQAGLFQNNALIPAMPKGVAQAFSLLQSSPEAQTVVASLASDKNVWEAVLKNPKVMEFCRNNQSSISESISEDSFKTNENKNEETPNEAEDVQHSSNGFEEFVNSVKVKAAEIVHTISNFVQDIFGTKTDDSGSEATASSSSGFGSFITPNTFFGLAIAVILVVLLKRA